MLKYFSQKIITKTELEDESYSLKTVLQQNVEESPQSRKLDYTEDYKKLISLLLGSLYVSFQSQTFSKSENIRELSKRLTEGASLLDKIEFPNKPVQFSDLKSKALGDITRKGLR